MKRRHDGGMATERSTTDEATRHWYLLVYRIPPEPTRLRAGVWRRLKGLGAIYVQGSVAALPAAPAAERALRTVRAEITSRIISWDSPYDQYSWRLDRATGYLSQYAPRGGWINTDVKCKRAAGDILRD